MTRKLYYKKADAMKAAKAHQREFGGDIQKSSTDHRTEFDFEDDKMQRMQWSGEICAVRVYGCKEGHDGLFAWWDD